MGVSHIIVSDYCGGLCRMVSLAYGEDSEAKRSKEQEPGSDFQANYERRGVNRGKNIAWTEANSEECVGLSAELYFV